MGFTEDGFGKRLKLRLEELRSADARVLEKVSISQVTLRSYKESKVQPTIEVAAKIAEAVGMSAGALAFNEGVGGEEESLLSKLRELPVETRAAVRTLIENLAIQQGSAVDSGAGQAVAVPSETPTPAASGTPGKPTREAVVLNPSADFLKEEYRGGGRPSASRKRKRKRSRAAKPSKRGGPS